MTYTNKEIFNAAQILRSFSNHHAHSDWNYTRNHDIKNIQFTSDKTGLDALRQRRKRFARHMPRAFKTARDVLQGQTKPGTVTSLFYGDRAEDVFIKRVSHAAIILRANIKFCMKKETHLPDGILDHGNIIVFWEETGEYLQLMQPPMANVICDLMESDPQHPMSQKFYKTLLEYAPAYIEKNTNSEEKFIDLSSDEHPYLHAYLTQYDFGNFAYISYPKLKEHLMLEDGVDPVHQIKDIVAES